MRTVPVSVPSRRLVLLDTQKTAEAYAAWFHGDVLTAEQEELLGAAKAVQLSQALIGGERLFS